MAGQLTSAEFEDLYRATAREVFAFVRRGAPDDAEDLVAEAYAIAWRRRTQMPERALRRAWLYGIARNLLMEDYRRRRRDEQLHGDRSSAAAAAPPPTSDDVRTQIVDAALARLRPEDREILRLSTWENLSPAELAVTLGVRPGTARVRLHRARRAFADDPQVRELAEEPHHEPSTAVWWSLKPGRPGVRQAHRDPL